MSKRSKSSKKKGSKPSKKKRSRSIKRSIKTKSKKLSKDEKAVREAQRRNKTNPCGKGKILRKGYERKSYLRASKKDEKIYVARTKVPAVCIKDIGKPGYGPTLIPPLTKGLLGKYKTSLSKEQRRKALEDVIKKHDVSEIYKHLRALVTLQRWNKQSHDIMLDDFNYLRKKYYPQRLNQYTPVGY